MPRTLFLLLPLTLLAAVANALAACPAPRWFVQRFVSADCEACWRVAPPEPRPGPSQGTPRIELDWIIPGALGEAAPLAVAALPEGASRVARAGALRSDETLSLATPLPLRSAWRLQVEDGPAWNGYVGLRWRLEAGAGAPLPPGLSAYLALVERVPAGAEGTPVARQLVRALAGPLPVGGGRVEEHTLALRLPENARPERLGAVGWLENAAGRVLAAAENARAGCAAPAEAGRSE